RILPQGSRGFYVRAERGSLPPRASDMLTARRQAIGGAGTCTPLDCGLVGCSFSVDPSFLVDVSITFVQLTPRRSPFRYAALATSPYIRSGRSPYQDPLYGASVVKRRFSFFSTLSLSPILLFGPGGAILPPRPLVPSAGARSGGQGWPAFGPPRQAARSVLDGREHDGRMRRLGSDTLRIAGSPLPPSGEGRRSAHRRRER